MDDMDVDRLAEDVMNAHMEFETCLYGKGRFPDSHFRAFFEAVARYVEATKDAKKIHRSVASAVSGLTDILKVQSSHAPGWAISDADRLECMLFLGYDPQFEGHEPPGL